MHKYMQNLNQNLIEVLCMSYALTNESPLKDLVSNEMLLLDFRLLEEGLRRLAERIEGEFVFPEDNEPFCINKLREFGIEPTVAIDRISILLNDPTISL